MGRYAQYFSCGDRQPNYANHHQRCFHLLKALQKYIFSVIPLVEDAVRAELPKKFGLKLDRWSDNLIYYVALFRVYMHHVESKETLIMCASQVKGKTWAHNRTMTLFVNWCQYMEKYLLKFFLVADNCSVNQLLAIFCNVPFIGRTSYELKLAIEKWIKDQSGLTSALNSLRELISKIRTLKKLSKTAWDYAFEALLPNETRWSGKFDMV